MEITILTPAGYVLAHASEADIKALKVVIVEGNWYFDTSLAHREFLAMVGNGQNYHCRKKEAWCDYYIFDDGTEHIDEVAWIYPEVTIPEFAETSGKIAFWKGKMVEQIDGYQEILKYLAGKQVYPLHI